jgi:hypothetical protein
MMRAFSFQVTVLLVLILALSACTPATPSVVVPSTQTPAALPTDPPVPTHTPAPTLPTDLPRPTLTSTPTKAPLSFSPASYKDDTAGFELDYPSGWTLKPKTIIGSRGSQAQLFSPGSSAETLAAGGTRIGITIYQWDPKNDLASYATHRRTAWDASGMTLVSQAGFDLQDGRKAMSFVLQSPDKSQVFFLFTTVGQDYLEISGEGNLALAEEIARTMRPLN